MPCFDLASQSFCAQRESADTLVLLALAQALEGDVDGVPRSVARAGRSRSTCGERRVGSSEHAVSTHEEGDLSPRFVGSRMPLVRKETRAHTSLPPPVPRSPNTEMRRVGEGRLPA